KPLSGVRVRASAAGGAFRPALLVVPDDLRADAAVAAPGAPRAGIQRLAHAASDVRHGDVWLHFGILRPSADVGKLVRVPPVHRRTGAKEARLAWVGLSCGLARIE